MDSYYNVPLTWNISWNRSDWGKQLQKIVYFIWYETYIILNIVKISASILYILQWHIQNRQINNIKDVKYQSIILHTNLDYI